MPLINRTFIIHMQDKARWENEDFDQMRYAFACDTLTYKCKDPFLDICSYFKRWDWDRVEDIVGKEALESLNSRALVTKDANGLTSVHDVILELGFEMSRKESNGKEVRWTFTSARNLRKFLEKKVSNL